MAKLPPETTFKLLVESNPHKVGSKNASLFAKLQKTSTVAEALSAGLTTSNLFWWHQHKIIELDSVAAPAQTTSRSKRNSEPVVFTIRKPVKNGVYLWGDPAIVASLIMKGETQSEVRFPNGNVRVVVNDWLTPIEEPT